MYDPSSNHNTHFTCHITAVSNAFSFYFKTFWVLVWLARLFAICFIFKFPIHLISQKNKRAIQALILGWENKMHSEVCGCKHLEQFGNIFLSFQVIKMIVVPFKKLILFLFCSNHQAIWSISQDVFLQEGIKVFNKVIGFECLQCLFQIFANFQQLIWVLHHFKPRHILFDESISQYKNTS